MLLAPYGACWIETYVRHWFFSDADFHNHIIWDQPPIATIPPCISFCTSLCFKWIILNLRYGLQVSYLMLLLKSPECLLLWLSLPHDNIDAADFLLSASIPLILKIIIDVDSGTIYG